MGNTEQVLSPAEVYQTDNISTFTTVRKQADKDGLWNYITEKLASTHQLPTEAANVIISSLREAS